MLMFEELSDIFSDHDNYLTTRELLMKVRVSLSCTACVLNQSCQSSSLPELLYAVLQGSPVCKPHAFLLG